MNEHELFSGSFDCTVVKWDTRFVKASTKQPFVHKIDVASAIQSVVESKSRMNNGDLEYLVSSMTPPFVHSLFFSRSFLLAGIENGLCLAFEPVNCELVGCRQLQPLNRALTQFDQFQLGQNTEGLVASGDGKLIDFVRLESASQSGVNDLLKVDIKKEDSLRIQHGHKINCIKFRGSKLYVADTSNDLNIYDFTDVSY